MEINLSNVSSMKDVFCSLVAVLLLKKMAAFKLTDSSGASGN